MGEFMGYMLNSIVYKRNICHAGINCDSHKNRVYLIVCILKFRQTSLGRYKITGKLCLSDT